MTAETKSQTAEAAGSCCSPTGSCHDAATTDDRTGGITTVYQVTGMTCGHCEGAVTGEISGIEGVVSVQAVAATGEVTVVSQAPLDEAAVRAAVDEAGYELTARS
ncbi:MULTISPECIES: heavy-metal-associated domain-containing protein [unclassified Streptomyces]|uniref:heavy-metal-associated domain-containing protein n=1 Tax=unclassified Streptomyces TaxID=2593676 RepID=UPI002E2D535D|nr:heavy-metal-associated domain-containing protein [Streptomyces sp. NBC_01429]